MHTAIGKFRDPSTFDEITEVLLTDPRSKCERRRREALGETRHQSAIPFLMEALRDPFWWYEKDQEVLVLLDAIEKMGSAVVDVLIERWGIRSGMSVNLRDNLGNLRDIRAVEELGMTVYDLHHEVSRPRRRRLPNLARQPSAC
jgi:HEAT repeat protein